MTGTSPQVGRKIHSEWSCPYAGRAASSNICTMIRPMSCRTHSSKMAQRNVPNASAGTVRGLTPPCGSRLPLDEGNKAEVLGFDLLEKAVHLEGILDILRMHDAQEIDRDFVLAQQAIALHHLLVGRLLALGHAVGVVQRRRTVEAEPDGKVFRRKKAAPVVIEEHAVRLDAVGDAPVGGLVLALQLDNLAKIVQPEEGRFAAVPEEIDHRLRGDLDLLDDVLLQQVVGHAKRLRSADRAIPFAGSNNSGSPGYRSPLPVWQRSEIHVKP